jgi:hypothetical protein
MCVLKLFSLELFNLVMFCSRNTSTFVPIKEGNSVIFYINTGGFPLMSDAWSQMWSYAKELQPSGKLLTNKLFAVVFLMAVFCMWIHWACAYMHQMNPLVQPIAEPREG